MSRCHCRTHPSDEDMGFVEPATPRRRMLSPVLISSALLLLTWLISTSAAATCLKSELDLVNAQALATAVIFKERGYELASYFDECMPTTTYGIYQLTMEPNSHYVIVTVGSQYTTDIDAWLYSEGGVRVDYDTAGDDYPVVEVFTPSYATTMLYKVRLYQNPYSPAEDAYARIMMFR